MTENAAKKDIQKLQRAIVDALEDVKGQEIQVFDTEHLSSLFERVIIASGTSNRQTKALAASVRDKVRNGSSWTVARPWCTSCSRPSALITTWKKSGVARPCA
jgi:Ribosomal silencing factor during starvation